MMLHSFDTHQVVKNFVTSGIKESQAEAIVKAINESRSYDVSNFATKADLMATEARLRAEIEKSKNDTLRWFVATQIASLTIILTFIKFLVV